MVKVEDGVYLAIAEVKSDVWSFLPHSEKQTKGEIYVQQVLSSLDFPTKTFLLPSEVEAKKHVRAMEEAVESDPNNDEEKNPLLYEARKAYTDWFTAYLEVNEMQQMKRYLVIEVSKEQIRKRRNQNSFRQRLSNHIGGLPILSMFASSIEDSPDEELTRLQLVRELSNRLEKADRCMRSLDVELVPLESEQKVLEVLFEFHNHHTPNYEYNPSSPADSVVSNESEMSDVADGESSFSNVVGGVADD
jgi:hypothetical protein